jgi:alpha-ribazole phosphatase
VKVYLIRHARTIANEERRYVGWEDVDLAEEGYLQAERLASRFQDIHISALYSSDLLRAVKTAEALGKGRGIKLERDPALREIHFGKWEGLTLEEIMLGYDGEMRKWYENPFQNAPPGGESFRDVAARMGKFITSLTPPGREGTIVIVSHGGAIRSILHKYLGLKEKEIWSIHVENTSVSLLQRNGTTFDVIFANDFSHLG